VNISPLPDLSGGQGWILVLRDITALKRMEKLRTQALTEAINKVRMPLAEAMNAVVDLNIRASQDERLASGLYRLTSVWEQIQSWGDEMMGVVHSDSERIIRPVLVEPVKVLDSLVNEQVVRLYQQSGGKVDITIDDGLPAVRTDPEMLNRLLVGLVRRAAQRSSHNGQVRISAREFRQQVWIGISDDGPLVPDADLLKIFDESSVSMPAGLDLARAKSILDRLDGQLWIGGQGPRGSSIIICLPVAMSGG